LTPDEQMISLDPKIPAVTKPAQSASPREVAAHRQTISISFLPESMPDLQRLPWHKPLPKWTRRDAQFIPVKAGLSRHIVRFVSVKGQAYAIKETAGDIA